MATEKQLIDKWEVIKLLRGKWIAKYPVSFYFGLIAAADEIEKLPEEDAVEAVHGRWAALDDDCEELEGEDEAMRWGCSACHEVVEYDDWTHRSRLTRFCPNCGAKMDGHNDGF